MIDNDHFTLAAKRFFFFFSAFIVGTTLAAMVPLGVQECVREMFFRWFCGVD